MKNIIGFFFLAVACLMFAGCPDKVDECDSTNLGLACSDQEEGCICLEEVDLNGEVWNRADGDPTINFSVDSRNQNSIEARLSNYDPSQGDYSLRMSADLNGDGEVGRDEVFFSQTPDQNGLIRANFAVSTAVGSIAEAILTIERGSILIINQPVCIKGPRCYIQIRGGGTTRCEPLLTHWEDFEGKKDCFATVDGELPISLGMMFDPSLTSPGAVITVEICQLTHLNTGTELLAATILDNEVI
jgi:hypothetical protein